MQQELKTLVDMRDRALQKNRIAFGNRIDAIMRGEDEASEEVLAFNRRWHERFKTLEEEADEDIATLAAQFPIIEEATQVKGVGFVNSAKVVALIDIERSNTISALWRYAGYAVIDGEAERLRKGEKAHFNRRLKISCRLVGIALMRAKNVHYRKEYEVSRTHYDTAHPDWTDGHRHNAAMRKVVKLWLSHLWEAWREMEGLPTRSPWIIEYGGHTTVKSRYDYGWPRNGADSD